MSGKCGQRPISSSCCSGFWTCKARTGEMNLTQTACTLRETWLGIFDPSRGEAQGAKALRRPVSLPVSERACGSILLTSFLLDVDRVLTRSHPLFDDESVIRKAPSSFTIHSPGSLGKSPLFFLLPLSLHVECFQHCIFLPRAHGVLFFSGSLSLSSTDSPFVHVDCLSFTPTFTLARLRNEEERKGEK